MYRNHNFTKLKMGKILFVHTIHSESIQLNTPPPPTLNMFLLYITLGTYLEKISICLLHTILSIGVVFFYLLFSASSTAYASHTFLPNTIITGSG